MAPEANGNASDGPEQQLKVIAWHKPALAAGNYKLDAEQMVSITGNESPGNWNFPQTWTFEVGCPRSALNPTEIQAVYPADGSQGHYQATLPHIVLRRSTLPWERVGCEGKANWPWLALLLFDDAEKPKPIAVDPKSLMPAGGDVATAVGIDLKCDLLKDILPGNTDDLEYLAHVRQICDAQGKPTEVAVVLGNRLPMEGGTSTVHLVAIDEVLPVKNDGTTTSGFQRLYENGSPKLASDATYTHVRLISLKSWSFGCQKGAGFQELVEGLNPYGKVRDPLPLPPATLRIPISGGQAYEAYLESGMAPLKHTVRGGKVTASWFHGPLAVGPPTNAALFKSRPLCSDELLRCNDDGVLDVSYAAAWELGRLLVLRSKAISTGLFLWKRANAQAVRRGEQGKKAGDPAVRSSTEPDGLPSELTQSFDRLKEWFDRLRKLTDVPFNYLVPDARMLPEESIRFFCIDPLWIAALLDGAASIGRVSEAEKKREMALPSLTTLTGPPARTWSGILIRSKVVAAYPGLLVDASYEKTNSCPSVRIDRLSPSILLAIFEGELESVSLHLRPEMLHFGFDEPKPGSGTSGDYTSFFKILRTADGREDPSIKVDKIQWGQGSGASAALRVFSPTELAKAMKDACKDDLPNPAQFAVQMIEGTPRIEFQRRTGAFAASGG